MPKLSSLSLVALLTLAVVGCTTHSAEDLSAQPTSTESQGRSDSTSSRATGSVPRDRDDDDHDDVFDDFEDCLELSHAYLALTAASAGLAFGDDDEIPEFEDDLDDVDERIPDELRADFETVASAYRGWVQAIKVAGGDIDDPDVRQRLENAQAEIDDPEVQAASERIQEFFVDSCTDD